MKNRRSFISAVASGGVGLTLLARNTAAAQTVPASPLPPAASPPPSPRASTTAKPPSAAALAVAMTMRSFDAKLTDDEIATIARGIDDNRPAGAQLNPKKKRLRNGDEPITRFAADGASR